MKTKMYLSILLAAFLFLASVQACIITSFPTPSSPVALSQPSVTFPGNPPAGNSQVPKDLGSISYTLDSGRKASADFDPASGQSLNLGVKDANGYQWMLIIPADVLPTSETITMTPFATMDTSQSAARITSGVQLEPDGLQFMVPALLTVQPPTENPGVGLIFSMQQGGSNVEFAPTTNTAGGKTAVATLWHFSSAGFVKSGLSSDEYTDYLRQIAKKRYSDALDKARKFLEQPSPTPPPPPAISTFCRGTEVNPEQGEAYEYTQAFLDPYLEVYYPLNYLIKTLQLLSSDLDISKGEEASREILKKAENSLMELGEQYKGKDPPDQLYALIQTGQKIELAFEFKGGDSDFIVTLASWAGTLRDYYLSQLKTKHDYRAMPSLMQLEKLTELLGGVERLNDILNAITFEVVLDTNFDGTWMSSGKSYATGHAEQHADVNPLEAKIITSSPLLWGDLNNLNLKVTDGSFTDSKGAHSIAGQVHNGEVWLKNYDACVTKTFDVVISGFSGIEDPNGWNTATAASGVVLKQYWWESGFFMFSVPIQNLSPKMGDQTFSGSGSAADGNFTGSAKVHIVIKHTPK